MHKVTIYGERCSGTNYLEELLRLNFDVEIIWDYGWKHFFGFNDLKDSDDVLFIGIIRNLEDWINSFYRTSHHVGGGLKKNINTFLTNIFFSVHRNNDEILTDRHIETNERYKNIFELRYIKNKYLIEKMPNLVKHYCLITLDEIIDNFEDIMHKLVNCNLIVKPNIEFPLNIDYYKKEKETPFIIKENQISREYIYNLISDYTELLYYENRLFPKKIWSKPDPPPGPKSIQPVPKSIQPVPKYKPPLVPKYNPPLFLKYKPKLQNKDEKKNNIKIIMQTIIKRV